MAQSVTASTVSIGEVPTGHPRLEQNLTGRPLIVTDLIGRDTALSVVSTAIASADRAGVALLVTGERGIGKSAFLAAAQSVAEVAGCQIFTTGGVATESLLAFASLHRLVRPLNDQMDGLPLAQRNAILTAIGMQDGPPPDRLVVSLAVLGIINEASRNGRLLIAVDDIELLDDASLEVLSFVARRLSSGQIIIATSSGAHRVPQLTHPFTEVALERLNDDESDTLIARCAADLDDDDVEWITERSVGNPLALVELAGIDRSLCSPRTHPFGTFAPLNAVLERAFGEGLDGLPQATQDALLVAALDEDSSLQEILAATSVLRGEPVGLDVFDIPRTIGLLSYDEARVAFAHPLSRSAIAGRESVGRHQAAHKALGETVVMNVGRRTWHRASGSRGSNKTIAAELEAYGRECVRRNDHNGAVMAWRRAAQLSASSADRARRLLLAATRAAGMGQSRLAEQLLFDAGENDLTEFDRLRAGLLRDSWDQHCDDSDRVLRLCAQARRAAAAGENALALELTLAAATTRFGAHVSLSALTEVTRMAVSLADAREDPKVLALLVLIDPAQYGRKVTDALSQVDSRLSGTTETLITLALAARGSGDYSLGLRLVKEAEAQLRIANLNGQLAPLLACGIDMWLEVGDWDAAAAALVDITQLTSQAGRPLPSDVLVAAAKIAALRGQVSQALELAVKAEHSTMVRRGSPTLAVAQIARGIAYIAAGRHFDAYSALIRVFDPKSPSHHFREKFGAVMYLAEAAVRCDQQEDVRVILDGLEPVAHTSDSHLLNAQLDYARAVLAPDDAAEELFLNCLSSDLAEWPWARARVQLAYGRWLRRQRRVSQARVPLRAAESTFRLIGATRWAAEALDELEAAGRPGGDMRADSEAASLSVQELKIARLAAAGLSNNEIGQQLYLSPRTVGSHLYRIFPKLGISARAQLASRLGELVE
jgi:DNA-binding CsgD family transcriptional regulator